MKTLKFTLADGFNQRCFSCYFFFTGVSRTQNIHFILFKKKRKNLLLQGTCLTRHHTVIKYFFQKIDI